VALGATGRLSLLRRNRGFALLFWATAGSAVGTYLAALALSVDILDRTDSGRWLAALLIADFLPLVVIGLTLGPLVDRLSRRRLMMISDLVRAGTFLALPFVDEPAAIVALAAVNGIATGFFRPAVWAGMPNLVADDEREQATSLLMTVENLAWIVGPVLAGGLLAASGPDIAYWVNAVTFVLSASFVARIPARSLRSDDPITRGHWADLRDGLSLVVRSRHLVTVLVVWSAAGIATACVNVAEVPLAKNEIGAGNLGLGFLVAATGVGLAVGSFFAAPALGALGMTRLYGGSLLVMGFGFGIASASPTIAVAAVLAGVATIGNGAAIVCNQVLVQRGAPDAMRGRALAVLMSSYYAVLGLSMAGAGILVDAAGARAAWALAGMVYLAASVLAFLFTSRTRDVAPESRPRREPAGLERLRALMNEVDETRRREQAHNGSAEVSLRDAESRPAP
jgi:MFS family permease